MPIKGISEQRRLPRLAKFHLGIKKQNAKGIEYPTATDYFVIPDEYKQYLGEKPTELSIMIPVEDDEIWCNQYYKCYSRTRGLTCRGDGATCKRMLDKDTGAKANRDTKEVVWKIGLECKGRECPDYLAKECKETMNLQFIMPDLPGLGVIQIDTSSINSIRNINSDATMIRAVYKRIAMLPLLLTLEPQEVVNPDDGKKKTVRCLHLRIKGSLRDLMLEAAKPVNELLLPAPAEDEAPMDTEKEFQPDDMPKISPKEAEALKKDLFADGGTQPSLTEEAVKMGARPMTLIEQFWEACKSAHLDPKTKAGQTAVQKWLKQQFPAYEKWDLLTEEAQRKAITLMQEAKK